ncbi:hypothetical protein LZP73_14730 [Shewanella sp. AS16]|uniref:hypothetical protein n=1 Tax=Shewanella sp. AS16 TaxID=2907625 RepID=UPI001F3C2E66|nr:hypothetical protein [Shewanella sp. AS16]MCE9687442.1 hypothetical protein [Shewanella sp. AS16]
MNNIPFLFTILLSVFAWTTNQIVSSLEKEPVIEITSKSYESDTQKLTYVLTNVSSSYLFKNLTFEIYDDSAKCFGKQDVILGPPNMKAQDTKKPQCSSEKSAEFEIYEFHPSSSIYLVANIMFDENRVVSALYVKSNEAIKVLPSGLQTFLIKHKLGILMSLFATWFVLICAYICFAKRSWLDVSS